MANIIMALAALVLIPLVFVWLMLLAVSLSRRSVSLSAGRVARAESPPGPRPEPRRCPTCGTPLPRNAPHGLCPKCLFQQGINSPVFAPPPRNGGGSGLYPAPFVAPTPAELAPYFPQLEILELLGQGGMGAVYKARQTKLDRLVALKILPQEPGRDPAFAERFNREARALARLNHPNIIGVHDFGEAGGLYYFLMEFVDGANLRQVLQAGRVEPAQALGIVPQLCDALQYAHEEGVVHRDIKPENILLDRRGRVKIADFGLAKLLGQPAAPYTLTGSRQVMGTPHYMAPEQMERPGAVDHRADIYSLGVVFYEMLTGELPLGRFALPSEKAAVDGRLDEVVLRALEKEPERRYQRASEVRTNVEAIRGGLPLPPPAIVPARSFQEEVDHELRRLQLLGPAAGLIVTGVLACAFWVVIGITALTECWDRPGDWPMAVTLNAVGAPLLVLATGILLVGGRRMIKLESYEFALLAAIWAMVPWSPAFFLGLSMGVWALHVLHRPEVKLAFARKVVQARLTPPGVLLPGTGPVQRSRRPLRSMLGALHSLIFASRADGSQESGIRSQESVRATGC